MRPFVVLSLLACSLFSTPAFAAWDIFQSYVILDAGSGNQFLAGGYNADAAAAFGGSDLGTFAASDVLTLNGGELNSYKNGSSNVCGGNVYYRVYASGETPGSFSSVALPYDSELANPGDQKWDETAAGIDLLAGLTAGGAYTLEVYWDLAGADSDPAGCGETKFDSNFGNNFTATFTFNVPGCTDANYAEYDANANTDDGSCATLMAVTNENTSATYATIQAAIDAATAGDVLTLAAAAFNPTGTVTVNKPLTINGAGSGSTTIYGGGTGYAIAVIADNVHLEGFTLNGAGSYGIKISNSTASVVQNFSMTDVATDGTTRTGIDLNGVDGATLTNIAGHNTTSGFGLAIASSANVTINGLTTSGNAWGDAAVYPAATEYQIAGFEAPTNITFAGDIDLSSGQGALSVQNGALASGGTWEGTVGFVAGETDIVTPPSTMNTLIRATRSDGLTFQIVGKGEALEFMYGPLQSATSPFSYTDIAFLDIGNRNWVVFGSLDIQTAIDAAMDGDQVELLSGPYAPSATINVDKSITLMGQGSGSTTIDVGGYNAWGIYITANDVTLSGVTIQGDAAVNEQFALKAGSGNSTGGTPSICENLTYSDIVIQGTKRTAIDLNGVDGATLTDITATGATGGFGMSISSSANVTVTNLTTSGNAWGDVGIFPANSPYQWPTLEGPTGITFGGTLDLSSGAGSISVQDGSLQSGGTWTGTISNDPADGADVTVPAAFSHVVNSTRDADGLVLHNVGPQAAIHALGPILAANGFSGTTIDDLDNGDIEVVEGLSIQDAIDAASAGDVIEILDGSYAIATPILVNKAVTLQGQSEAGTVLTCEAALGGANSIQVTAGATLKDFTLEANSYATFGIHVQPGTDGAALSGLTINNTGSNGIGLSGVTNATVSDIAGSGNVQYILGIAGSVGVSASDISGGNVGVYKGTGTYAQSATDIAFTGTFDLAGGFIIEQLAGADEITYAIDGSAADVQVPAAFDRVFFANYTSLPLPPPYNEASLATLVEAGNLATAIGTAQALDAAGYGLEGAAVYNLTADQWEVSAGLAIQDAIDRAEAGDVIEIADGSYAIATPILVNKAVTLQGQSEAGTVLTCEAALGGANSIQVTAGATLKDFTLEANSNATFGIHVQPGTDGAALSGLTINNTGSNGIGLSGVTNATVSDIAGSGNVQYILGIAGSVGVSASDISGGNVGVYKGTGTYAQTATDIAFTGTFDLAGGFIIEQLAGADEITYSIDGSAADVQIPAAFDRVFFANYTSLPLPPPYNEASLATLVEAGNLATAIGTAQALDAYGYGLEDAAVYNLTADQWEVSAGLAIQDAIDRAEAGDVIDVSAGTYEEDLALNKGVTINGPNAGIAHDGTRGAEAIIDGEHTLSAAAAMTLDGIEFLSNNPAQTSTIFITTAAGHAIQNNRFVSSVAGGGTDDKALYTAVLASGSMTISGNSFSGNGSFSDGDRYSSAAWGRGIWLNGGGAAVTISGNALTNCRTGMNLENYFNGVCSVDGNTFTDCGTGLSMSNPSTAAVTTITANRFQDVDTDLNLRNLTQAVTWDLATSDNLAIPGNSTFYSDLGYIPGNSAGDIDDPNGNLAFLSGNGADNLTFGADDNTVTGDYTGAGNDYINGGDGTDRVNYSDNETDVTLTAGDGFVIMDSPNGGSDTLVNIEYLVLADATISLIGCTFPDACNFNDDALVDDGSCEFTTCAGCRDEDACNYDSEATLDGPIGTCTYPGLYEDCAGNCVNDTNSNNICDELEAIGVEGCTDATATNYNPDATEDDGSCYTYTLAGCLIPSATNYDPTVNVQGEPISAYCIFPWNAAFMLPSTDCADPSACNYDAAASGYTECDYCLGCIDAGACNYDDTALYDNGACTYTGCSGCTSDCSSNYDATAVIDDGTCDYANCGGCTDSEADNYNPAVSIDDGSCQYEGCTLPSACNFDPDANANDGSCSLDPAPVISAVDLVLSTTSLSAADGEVSVTVDSGTPVSLDLEGLNGTTDASFSYPGTYNGLAAGYYAATVTDGFGCVSNSLNVVVSYDLCCDCGVSDVDSDGICDDEDNCTDKSAPNYADPANTSCPQP